MAINRLGETRVQGRRNSLLFTHHPDNNNILRPITEITRHRKQSISPQKLITKKKLLSDADSFVKWEEK